MTTIDCNITTFQKTASPIKKASPFSSPIKQVSLEKPLLEIQKDVWQPIFVNMTQQEQIQNRQLSHFHYSMVNQFIQTQQLQLVRGLIKKLIKELPRYRYSKVIKELKGLLEKKADTSCFKTVLLQLKADLQQILAEILNRYSRLEEFYLNSPLDQIPLYFEDLPELVQIAKLEKTLVSICPVDISIIARRLLSLSYIEEAEHYQAMYMQNKKIEQLSLTTYIDLLAFKGQFDKAQSYLLKTRPSSRIISQVMLDEIKILWPLSIKSLLDQWPLYKEEKDFVKQLMFFKMLIAKQEVDKAIELIAELNDKDHWIGQLTFLICFEAKSYPFHQLKHLVEQIQDLDQQARAWENVIEDYLLPKGFLTTVEKVIELLPNNESWQSYKQKTIDGLNRAKRT